MENLTKTEKSNGSPQTLPASEGTGKTASIKSVSQEINACPREPLGHGSNSCRRCGRTLSAKRSRQCGYGSTCITKVREGSLKRAKSFEQKEPRTVTDPTWAELTIQTIYSLLYRISLDDAGGNARCSVCGTTIHEMPIESFDHSGGMALPGFGRPQWVYLHDDHNDLAVWKLGITAEIVIADLERKWPGQVPAVPRPTSPAIDSEKANDALRTVAALKAHPGASAVGGSSS